MIVFNVITGRAFSVKFATQTNTGGTIASGIDANGSGTKAGTGAMKIAGMDTIMLTMRTFTTINDMPKVIFIAASGATGNGSIRCLNCRTRVEA